MSKEKRLVPELRFPEFDGEWDTSLLGNITSLIKDGTHGSHSNVDDGPYLLSAKNIKNGKILISDNDRKIKMKDFESIYRNYALNRNDILMTIVGTIGELVIIDDLIDNIAFQRSVAIIRVNKDYNSNYFYHLFQSKFIKMQLNRSKSLSAQGGVYLNDLKKIVVRYPGIEEQQKIATFLSLIDKKIELLEKKVELLEEQKRGLLQKIFTQEIRFKKDDGSEFGRWESLKLEEVASIKKGVQLSKQNMIDTAEFYVLNGGKSISGFTDQYNTKENTISISEGGESCGYVSYNEKKFWAGGHLYTLNNVSINKIFLFQYLKYKESEIMRLRVGSGLPNIQKGPLSTFKVIKISVKEQEIIADFFSKQDFVIDHTKGALDSMNTLKKGLLQKLFI